MKVEIVKVLVLFALFIMTFILGLVPLFLKNALQKRSDTESHRARYKTVLSLLSCYAAGVFLATGVLDLLPSVRVDIGTTLNSFNIFTSFPIAEFVMMFGLFLILIVEQIVLHIKEKHSSADPESKPLLDKASNSRVGNDPTTRVRHSHSVTSQHSNIGGISDEPFSSSFPGTHQHCPNCQQKIPVTRQRSVSSVEQHEVEEEEHEILPEHEHSSLRSVMLIVALSLHSIFEGLAVGLQSSADQVIGIFAALLIHKSVLSFCLGMNLIQSKLSHGGVFKSILFFSLTSPIGIAIGIGIIHLWSSQSSVLVQGILSGIACGTFLYVVFFEVLPSEFNCYDHRLLKVLFLLLGFATVTGVLFLDKDNGPTCYVVKPT